MSAPFASAGLPFDLPQSCRRPSRPSRRRPAAKARVVEQWPLEQKINVVLFAGMGGACQGLEDAGLPVHVAVNHDEIAIAAHRALNPHTRHLQADIYEVDPIEATGGRPVGNLWGSPDCRDHSIAKGGAPRSPRVRSMPWQMCRWIGVLRKHGLGPDTAYLENVREIRGWAPLIAKRCPATGRVVKLDGTVAAKGERVPREQQHLVRDKRQIDRGGRGRTYKAWVKHVRRLGARYEDRDLDCSEYGVPTSRKRLFGVARFDGLPIVWPQKAHGHRKSAAVLAGKLLPAAPAASIIDWSLKIPSIFDRDKDLAPNTQKRIAVGMRRFVLETPEPFLVHLTHHGSRPAMDLADAAATFTGAHRGEIALAVPAIVPTTHTGPDRVHDGAGSVPALTAGVKGGELAISAAHLMRYHGERRPGEVRGEDMRDGVPTSTTENRFAVVAAHLSEFRSHSVGHEATDPAPSATAQDHHAVIAASLIQTGYGERQGQAPRALDIEDSIGTQVAGGEKHAVIAAHLTEFRQGHVGRDMRDSTQTITSNGHQENRQGGAIPIGVVGAEVVPAAAWMLQNNYLEPGHSPSDPTATLVQKVGPVSLAAAYLAHLRGTGTALPAAGSLPAQTAGGDRGGAHIGVTAAYLGKYYGQEGQGQAAGVPLDTLSTNDRFGVTGADLASPPLTPAQVVRAREVAEFLRKHGVWSGGEFVTVGDRWIVVDIGMRMLKPHEAAAAHELRLPEQIEIVKRVKGVPVRGVDGRPVMIKRPLTKTEAMRLVGNSVPKRMAMLLAQCNSARALSVPMQAAE